jgi:hypothetical protein
MWLVATLITTVGLPFFILSTNAPLLQAWFSKMKHKRARDPYFLYAASNMGSLLALIGYPVLIEPNLKLRQQSLLWAACYGMGVALMLACAIVFLVNSRTAGVDEPSAFVSELTPDDVRRISWSRRLKWAVLSMVPSSLMLGVTTYISSDLAPVPLLWVIPLSLYLLSFILQFARKSASVRVWERFLLPLFVLPVVFSLSCGATIRFWFFIPMHVAFFFAACMVCHGQLANDRPTARHLTEFYLWLAIGGALGGLFSALVAPLLFHTIIEYPLMIVVACVLRSTTTKLNRWDWLTPLLLLLLLGSTVVLLQRIQAQTPLLLLAFAISLFITYTLVERPTRFALAVLAILLAGTLYWPERVRTLHAERNFFGVLRVMSDGLGSVHYLLHGTTQHGRQLTSASVRCKPTGYYHPTGPFGSIAQTLSNRSNVRVAIIGLGAGAQSAYAVPGQEWTYYEIDPAVVRIAHTQDYFSYLSECAQAPVREVIGDGRLRLKEAAPNYYSLITIDAFSSDAVPQHLLTLEAIELYFSKLTDEGILAFHISNRHLNLSRVLGSAAATYGVPAIIMREDQISSEEESQGKDLSTWVVFARKPEDLAQLTLDTRWKKLGASPGFRTWTDDFSNIFSILGN